MKDEKIINLLDQIEGSSVEVIEMLAFPDQLLEIERLLHTSTLDDIKREDIERRMTGFSNGEAAAVISMLYDNQHVTDKEMYKRIANYDA